MDRKTILSLMMGLLASVGLLFAAVPFFGSLGVNAKAENAAWGGCDLSDLEPGKLKICGYAKVYRRTEKDRSEIGKYLTTLQDPHSLKSEQPETAINEWRSENSEYFVFRPWGPARKSGIILREAGDNVGDFPPELTSAIKSLPYFYDPYDGRVWDTSGRLYAFNGYPPEYNLIVPQVRWVSATEVMIYGAM